MERIEIRRNSPCWCGSGKKFKNCHRNRSDQAPVQISDVLDIEKKVASRTRLCLAPLEIETSCDGEIVRAHSIQRNGGLSQIALNGHVYRVGGHFSDARESTHHYRERLVGCKNASTFTGFCKRHDCSLFSPIETQSFVFTKEQCFLLGYRALCKELFEKLGALDLATNYLPQLDGGRSLPEQIYHQGIVNAYRESTELGLRDIRSFKCAYDSVLKSKDYTTVEFYALTLDRVPDVMCSGFLSPSSDFCGNRIQSFTTLDGLPTPEVLGHIAFSLIATDTGGAAVFTWLRDHADIARRFVRSLCAVNIAARANLLVRFVFECFDNFCFSPKWWDALSEPERHSLLLRILDGMESGEPSGDFARDDGLRLVEWTVTGERESICKQLSI